MNGADQWYYLAGTETRGPVPSAEIVRLIHSGSLAPATQVAQAGWQTWSPASVALANLLGGASAGALAGFGVGAGAPYVAPQPTYAIKLQCVAGPDAGKAYMIGVAEVSLGRVSGIGEHDPQVSENHVVVSWQNNVIHFRTFPGAEVRVAGNPVTQGTLSNGQQFQMGASIWQVGSAPVELTNLLGNLGSRLNQLASTEKLEGFSLGQMFSETFKGRKEGEVESYFVVGTTKTTPPLEEVETGWPKPWFFMRVFIFMAGVYLCFYWMFDTFHNPRLIPGLIMMGSMVVPLTVAFFFWEMNTPRNISFHMVLRLVCLGGVISLAVSLIGFNIANLEWLGAASAGIVEETGKLLAVVLVVRNLRYRWILNGMACGAAIGAGFAAFETAGYAFSDGFFDTFLTYFVKNPDHIDSLKDLVGQAVYVGNDGMLNLIHSRSYFAPFAHVLWTAITAGALWRVKGAEKFRFSMLTEPTFMRTFMIPMLLHMTWNSPLLQFGGLLGLAKYALLGIIGWYVAFTLIQQGLRQVREAQLTQAQTEYKRTQEVITTSGRFRVQSFR
ncbi:MAG TPA: PrsW family glutamic-type intramembrane protease [Bryobacteraceae bacterium]|nr:PrsW family glutamic-type intramembrane protease [Bryobacteraceae bacterium]